MPLTAFWCRMLNAREVFMVPGAPEIITMLPPGTPPSRSSSKPLTNVRIRLIPFTSDPFLFDKAHLPPDGAELFLEPSTRLRHVHDLHHRLEGDVHPIREPLEIGWTKLRVASTEPPKLESQQALPRRAELADEDGEGPLVQGMARIRCAVPSHRRLGLLSPPVVHRRYEHCLVCGLRVTGGPIRLRKGQGGPSRILLQP